ncbi:serine/arginine repetitive matrix protein 1-like [Sarcophilus harrisii]|uniref:serine/arginine repetitive matrix protein 1-like n=1 Tax=Sarcophilus harrisii TaxID=9305 RepID=UPI001301F5C1|nr:serine/arginine repetitive matrix protein 1-like [Sarcophilus harrisii]
MATTRQDPGPSRTKRAPSKHPPSSETRGETEAAEGGLQGGELPASGAAGQVSGAEPAPRGEQPLARGAHEFRRAQRPPPSRCLPPPPPPSRCLPPPPPPGGRSWEAQSPPPTLGAAALLAALLVLQRRPWEGGGLRAGPEEEEEREEAGEGQPEGGFFPLLLRPSPAPRRAQEARTSHPPSRPWLPEQPPKPRSKHGVTHRAGTRPLPWCKQGYGSAKHHQELTDFSARGQHVQSPSPPVYPARVSHMLQSSPCPPEGPKCRSCGSPGGGFLATRSHLHPAHSFSIWPVGGPCPPSPGGRAPSRPLGGAELPRIRPDSAWDP